MVQQTQTKNQNSNALAQSGNNVPALNDETLAKDAGAGFDEVKGRDDLAIPFIVPLSHANPETIKGKGEYIEGAKAGMILNKVTKDLYNGETGITVVPLYFQKQFVEWEDRGTGSRAPLMIHPSESTILTKCTRDSDGKLRTEDNTYIEDTRNHYVLLLKEDGTAEPAIIAMKGSQLKKSRRWNTIAMGQKVKDSKGQMFTAPLFAFIYTLTTTNESNDKGNWTGWDITLKGKNEDPAIYGQARALYTSIKKGDIQARPVQDEEKSATAEKQNKSEEIPF